MSEQPIVIKHTVRTPAGNSAELTLDKPWWDHTDVERTEIWDKIDRDAATRQNAEEGS